jgi:hypothetical protein
VKVDLEKSVQLGRKICGFISDYLEKHTMNTAEVLIALNEVAYHVSNASKIPADTPSLDRLRTPIA